MVLSFLFLKVDVLVLCSLNGLWGLGQPAPLFTILDCFATSPHRAHTPGLTPHCLHPGNLGCQPDPRAPGSKEISISVHFGLVLASSHHLQHSSLGTRQRHPKNWLDEPLEHEPALGCWLLWYVEKTFLEKSSGKERNSTPRN